MAVYKLQIVDENGNVVQQDDITPIEQVNVEVSQTTGEASGSASYGDGVLDIHLQGVKGETGDDGQKGEKGDTVILGDGQQYTLYNEAGSHTDGAMTQKATTDEMNKNSNEVWTNLDITWNTNDKYYNENGGLTSTSGYNNALVDVSEYQGRKVVIYVYMGAVVCSMFKDENGNRLTYKKSMTSGTWSTTIPANATSLCLSNSRSKLASPYVKVHTSNKLAIEVANENAAAIATLATDVEKVNFSAPASDTYAANMFTVRNGYYIPDATGVETANSSYRVYKNIPVSIIKTTITHDGGASSGFHCYDSGGNWLGLVSKGVNVANLPSGTTELRISTTSTNITITCPLTAKQGVERLFTERNQSYVISVKTKVGDLSTSNNGEPQLNGSYAITDYIPLYGAMGVEYPNGDNSTNYIIFYDKNLNYVGGKNASACVAPANSVYFAARVGSNSIAGNNVTLVLKGIAAPKFTHLTDIHRKVFNLTSYLEGKKLAILGDSITAASYQGHWVRLVNQMLGTTATNVAIAGKTYANGQIAEQVTNLVGDEKLAIIFAGTNDFNTGGGSTLGTAYIESGGARSATTGNSTAAGVHSAINAIYTKCGYIPIVIMTPLPRPGDGGSSLSSWQANSKGLYLEDYANMIKKVAEFYSIPVLDLFHDINLPAPLLGTGTYYADGVHPLINVHGMIARLLYKFLLEKMVRW